MTLEAEEDSLIRELLLVRYRRNALEEQRFLELVDSIRAPISKNLVHAMFMTFVNIEDYGTQETVIGKLCEADIVDYFSVLSVELPRIINDNPDAAEDLLIRGVREHPNVLLDQICRSDDETVHVICDFISDNPSDLYPELSDFLARMKDVLKF